MISRSFPPVVFDDCTSWLDESIDQLVRVHARHNRIHLFILSQNLFPNKLPHFRSISLNCKYIHLFANYRDRVQPSVLFRQITGSQSSWLENIFNKEINGHKVMTIDLTPQCTEAMRFRSNILMKNEEPIYVYAPKGAAQYINSLKAV